MENYFFKGNHIPVTIFKKNKICSNNLFGTRFFFFSTSKGKGFSGTIKRYNFASNYKTHGNSKAHRKPGSIGMCQDPGRVFKGKKMAGRMGGNRIIIKNIKVVFFNKYLIFLEGSFPGSCYYKSYLNDIKR